MSKRIGAVVIIVLALALGGAALAQEVQEQPLVNLFLFESSIRDALSEISLQTGVNIIPDSTVSGRVTVDLQDGRWSRPAHHPYRRRLFFPEDR